MGRTNKKENHKGSAKVLKEANKKKSRQINREFSLHAYNNPEDEVRSEETVDSFEDYAEDLAFEKFSRNGKR